MRSQHKCNKKHDHYDSQWMNRKRNRINNFRQKENNLCTNHYTVINYDFNRKIDSTFQQYFEVVLYEN